MLFFCDVGYVAKRPCVSSCSPSPIPNAANLVPVQLWEFHLIFSRLTAQVNIISNAPAVQGIKTPSRLIKVGTLLGGYQQRLVIPSAPDIKEGSISVHKVGLGIFSRRRTLRHYLVNFLV